MPTVKLTASQLRLIDNLLYDHIADGSYWGKKREHEKLVILTRDIVKRALGEEGK